jgi:hypothetical protein
MATKPSVLRNVTALSSAPGTAAILTSASGDNCDPNTSELVNVLARGGSDDLSALGGKCQATIEVEHSNFRAAAVNTNSFGTVVQGPGNQTAAEPLLALDGFHQLPGSPTIDAGITSPSPFDIDGEARLMGLAPDIGADELTAAAADTVAPVGSGLAFRPRTFVPRRGRSANISVAPDKPRKRAPKGSTISYTLSEAATTVFTFERRLKGVRRGKRCLTGAAARGRDGKRCVRFVAVKGGTLSHSSVAGSRSFRFSGVLDGRPLKPGSYRMTGVPTDAAGNVGAPFRASFRIARP